MKVKHFRNFWQKWKKKKTNKNIKLIAIYFMFPDISRLNYYTHRDNYAIGQNIFRFFKDMFWVTDFFFFFFWNDICL